jgi:hypothetical protein
MNGYMTGDQLYFLWNTSYDVGLNSPNLLEDIQLVQFGFICAARDPRANFTPELKKIISDFVIGAPSTGVFGDPMVMAIIAFQNGRTGFKDKKIHPLADGRLYYSDDYISLLGRSVQRCYPDIYPRIDKALDCPPLVKEFVVKVMQPKW